MSSLETRDDAGFIPFGGGLLLQTTDFFTPIVDDPYRFGQIAAANAPEGCTKERGTIICQESGKNENQPKFQQTTTK